MFVTITSETWFRVPQRSKHPQGMLIKRQQCGQMAIYGRSVNGVRHDGIAQLPNAWMHIVMLAQATVDVRLVEVRLLPIC